MIFLILAQLLSSSLRQEQRLLRLYQLNAAANRVFNTVNEEAKWADSINIAPKATTNKLVLQDLDGGGAVINTRQIALKIRPGGVPGDPEYSIFYDDGSGAGEIDLLPSNMEVTDLEFKNDQNANDVVNDYEYRPLIITSLALKSRLDDLVVVERQTVVANLSTVIELPGSGVAGGGTPYPTITDTPHGGHPGYHPCMTCHSPD